MPKTKLDFRSAILDTDAKVEEIVEEVGIDVAWRAFKKPIEKWLKDEFMNGREKLREKTSGFQVMQLKGKRYNPLEHIVPPDHDHPEMYYWRSKPLFYVYHPYDGVDEKALAAFCDKYGFGYEISCRSWYFVGKTIRVMIFDPLRRAEYEEATGKRASVY